MTYDHMVAGIFLSRPNRFLARVEIKGKEELCHVKNTGRCAELLVPGAQVYVQEHSDPSRKTNFSLITVKKGERLINMDSQAPNRAAAEWLPCSGLFPGLKALRRERVYGESRFDFYAEADTNAYLEVKGVTLEEDGIVRFPDAPTERGVKHVLELCHCREDGYEAYLLFVIQMKGVKWLEPNDRTHPEFGEALRRAQGQGVRILAVDCAVGPDFMELRDPVEVRL